MEIKFCKILQDGKLTPTAGRIVIFQNFIDVSNGPSRDHNDLLRSLAAKYKLNKDSVISNAIRLYWDYSTSPKGEVSRARAGAGNIIVCPVRKLDEDLFYSNEELNMGLIKEKIKR